MRAAGSLLVWRRDEDNQPRALRITKRGLAAIQVDDGGAQSEAEEPRGSQQLADLAPDKLPRRVAAAHRKKTSDEAPQHSAKLSRGVKRLLPPWPGIPFPARDRNVVTLRRVRERIDLGFAVGVGQALLGDGAGNVLTSIESLVGSSFNDTLTGNAGVNQLLGGAGTDILRGRGRR